ncbi:SDR family oxidoreductase [Gloeobacter morelensis]|uniref:SDR family oxidoreductase n=1 Tax=Gloeobacter morelensis MG652769 TaxID=2781736 RepID=A0ABY3PL50_9CYAN|nr:SDR family oxidoreductase [Gloeobacter morelensis]UFP94314.1 SDR family oxidoreductase [Gloeobacter morelensis MG652769]
MFLVTGATGDLGRRIVRSLRGRGQPVRAFVRLEARYADLEQMGAEIFIGDLRRRDLIERAVRGARYVISAHGTRPGQSVAEVEYQANIDLIEAAQVQGVERFVYISVLGADRHYDDAPVFKAKREVEKYLTRTQIPYTVLRPAGFASNLLTLARNFERTGFYFLIGRRENRTSLVSTDDLSEIAIQAASLPEARNRTFAIGGPESLRRDEIPKIFEKLFNRAGQILQLPIEAFDAARTLIGLVNPVISRDLGTLRVLLANEYTCDPHEVQQVFQIELESLHHFLRRNLLYSA